MCDLILNWIVQQLQKENSTLQELGEYVCKIKIKKKRLFQKLFVDAFTLSER